MSKFADRIKRLESRLGLHKRPGGVLICEPGESVEAAIVRAGALPGSYIVVPADLPVDEWERMARAYRPPDPNSVVHDPAPAPVPTPK